MKDIRDIQLINEGAEIVTLTKEHYNYKLQNKLLFIFSVIILTAGVFVIMDYSNNENQHKA